MGKDGPKSGAKSETRPEYWIVTQLSLPIPPALHHPRLSRHCHDGRRRGRELATPPNDDPSATYHSSRPTSYIFPCRRRHLLLLLRLGMYICEGDLISISLKYFAYLVTHFNVVGRCLPVLCMTTRVLRRRGRSCEFCSSANTIFILRCMSLSV